MILLLKVFKPSVPISVQQGSIKQKKQIFTTFKEGELDNPVIVQIERLMPLLNFIRFLIKSPGIYLACYTGKKISKEELIRQNLFR